MMKLHYLNNSRAQRVLWLLEELGLDYELVAYQRDAKTNLAPPELKDVHPLGKSPMLEIDGRLVVESGAIVELLCARYAPDMVPERTSDAFIDHLEWMHFAEGSAMTPVLLGLYTGRLGEAGQPLMPRISEQLDAHFTYMEAGLRDSGHFVLNHLSAADIMLSFPAEIAIKQGYGDRLPKVAGFVEAIHNRPAFKRALEQGVPYNMA